VSTFQPAGIYYDKYHTRNPVARWLMKGFLDSFDSLCCKAGVERAVEVGCGEGELSIRMASAGIRVSASDIAEDAIAEARRRAEAHAASIDFSVRSLEQMRGTGVSPMVVCCEVLEHLDDPELGLEIIQTLSSKWLLVSVPREPVWRALNMLRGKYLRDFGNTPGHVNHWSTGSFRSFVSSRFNIVDQRTPLPWTMLLCQRR
jgi:2-polyprenyl-3-methyl-5-hydroxy-6-metoxy-1,4-benzoquinol methylase